MANINILQELEEVLDSAAGVAGSLQRKVSVFAGIGLLASASIAWLLYSPESSLGWNLVKCGLVFLPALVICFIWQILANFADAPQQLAELTSGDEGLIHDIQSLSLNKPEGFRGLISMVRAIRNEESLSSIIEVVGSIALLANPLFLLIVFISVAILLLLIIITPFVLIF